MSKDIELAAFTQEAARNDVTGNESIAAINSLMSRSVETTLSSPPGSPTEGFVWALGVGPSGDWTGRQEHDLAVRLAASWKFVRPQAGWLMWFKDSGGRWRRFTGSAWANVTAAADADTIDSTGGAAGSKPRTLAAMTLPTALTDSSGGSSGGSVAAVGVGGTTGGTANGSWEDASTAVTGVDGTGNNAASKADVDARLAAIANNFEEVNAKLTVIADGFASVLSRLATQLTLDGVTRDSLAKIAAELNGLRGVLRTGTLLTP